MKVLVKILLCFMLLAGHIQCEKSSPVIPKTLLGEALGTTYSIQYFSDFLSTEELESELNLFFQGFNHSLSTYQLDSDISRINQGDSTVVVDNLLQTVFEKAKEIHKDTDGLFDPTVGALVNAWGFGPEKALKHISQKEVDSLLDITGFSKVALTEKKTIVKQNSHIYLDFNAIAKGYAVDLICKVLENHGIEDYLVEVGGELRASGKNKTHNSYWKVGIDKPQEDLIEREVAEVVELKNGALATSGNYRKFRIDSLTGQKFVHTINPRTGYPARTEILSATVWAKDCMTADAYATALMTMDIKKASNWHSQIDSIEFLLLYHDTDKGLMRFQTEGFLRKIE